MSLRGIGPSGQSRTLVLLDGVPFNDPFGGWVYWTRVPLASVDRVEITEGIDVEPVWQLSRWAASSTSSPAGRRGGRSSSSRSTAAQSSPKFDFFASDQWNKVAAAVEGSFLNTDGFPIVAAIERGPIDNNANVEYKNVTGKLEFTPSDRVQGVLPRRLFHREPQQREGRRAERHAVDDRERRRPRAAAGRQRPAGARVRRRRSGRTSTSWR